MNIYHNKGEFKIYNAIKIKPKIVKHLIQIQQATKLSYLHPTQEYNYVMCSHIQCLTQYDSEVWSSCFDLDIAHCQMSNIVMNHTIWCSICGLMLNKICDSKLKVTVNSLVCNHVRSILKMLKTTEIFNKKLWSRTTVVSSEVSMPHCCYSDLD